MSKSSLYGLLAFAVSSSLLVAQGDKPAAATGAGWTAKPGSGLSFDGGDAYGLKWSNRLQVHWTFAANEDLPDTNSFNIRRARTGLSGHVFNRDITYNFVLDGADQGASGDGAIKYAWVQWNFSKSEDGEIGLRTGQSKSPYGLEARWTSGGLWFVERASAARAFSDAFTRGAWIEGRMMGKEKPLRFAAGAQNGDVANGLGAGYTDVGEETANSDNELTYVASANWDLLGDFHDGKQTVESRRQGDWRTDDTSIKGTVGAGICLGNGKVGGVAGPDIESTSFNINTAWSISKFNLLGEFFLRTDDPQGAVSDEEKPTGFAFSGGYLLDKSGDSPLQWGFGLRYSLISTDNGGNGTVNFLSNGQGFTGITSEADVSEISLVANAFYHSHACKTQMEWTIQNVDPSGGNSQSNNIFRIGFQLEF